MLEEGSKAPDFTLDQADGPPLTLGETVQAGYNVLLIFFRHLGWMHCRDHVVRVHQQEQRFQARDTRVWVIGFAPARRVRGWLERAEVSFPFLLDPAQEVYERYEIERSMLRSWSPRNLWSYVKAFFRGRELHGIREDPNRLGADFIVDRQRRLRFVYYSQDPTDRPAVETLLEKLKEIEE